MLLCKVEHGNSVKIKKLIAQCVSHVIGDDVSQCSLETDAVNAALTTLVDFAGVLTAQDTSAREHDYDLQLLWFVVRQCRHLGNGIY